MKVKSCSCKQCRWVRRTPSASAIIRQCVRSARRRARKDIAAGREPAVAVYVPYLS